MTLDNMEFKYPYNKIGFVVSKNPSRIVRKSFYETDSRIFSKTEIYDLLKNTYQLSETWSRKSDSVMELEFSNVVFEGKMYDRLNNIFVELMKQVKNKNEYVDKILTI